MSKCDHFALLADIPSPVWIEGLFDSSVGPDEKRGTIFKTYKQRPRLCHPQALDEYLAELPRRTAR